MSKVKAPLSLRSLQRAAAQAVPGRDGASAKVLGATAIFAAGVGVAVHAETTTSLPAVQVDAPKEKPRPATAPAAVIHHAARPRSARRATVHTAARGIVVPGAQTAARSGASGAGAPAPFPPTRSPPTPIHTPTRPRPIRSTASRPEIYGADRRHRQEHHGPHQGSARDKNATGLKDVAPRRPA